MSQEVAQIAIQSAAAFEVYQRKSGAERAAFLEAIARQIEAIGDMLLETANRETHLPLARLTGERGRTCAQLRMFVALIQSDGWKDVRIEEADPDRQPLPKPRLIRTKVALGPVAVFGASNFPLAFSVAGGDTASALAAGCSVVVKAHPAHPETSRLVAQAIHRAVQETGMPEGVFQMVEGGIEVGEALVNAPEISAVGFTGSLQGGRALFNLAAKRPRPIPVYAEMGSINPIFITQGALAERGETLAKGYADSLTLGVGQFCTNPGLVVIPDNGAGDKWIQDVLHHLAQVPAGQMLHDGIASAYVTGVEKRVQSGALEQLFVGGSTAPALFAVAAQTFLKHHELQEELFGPSAIVVKASDQAEMLAVARTLEGQLTATIHFAASEGETVRTVFVPILSQKAGRLVANGFPTGVEVNSAMQHGGPYPATTDSRSTSVGTAAIDRFVRPVAYQSFPADWDL